MDLGVRCNAAVVVRLFSRCDHHEGAQRWRAPVLPASEMLREGWTRPDDYHWICETCFSDFREQFGWQLVDERRE